jgi:hypothetical protein
MPVVGSWITTVPALSLIEEPLVAGGGHSVVVVVVEEEEEEEEAMGIITIVDESHHGSAAGHTDSSRGLGGGHGASPQLGSGSATSASPT